MREFQRHFAILAVILLVSGCGLEVRTEDVTRTSLCDLVAAGPASDGRRVRISVIFETDGIENSVLTDSGCPKSAIALSSLNGPEADAESIESFDQLVESNPMTGSGYRKVDLDVTGVIHWRTDQRPFVVIYPEKVWNAKRLE